MKKNEAGYGNLTNQKLSEIVKDQEKAENILIRLNSVYKIVNGTTTQGLGKGLTLAIESHITALSKKDSYQQRAFYLLENNPEQYKNLTIKLVTSLLESVKKHNPSQHL